ncbi:MAG: hypothetical protein ABH843_03580 [Candidatus Omnitrophota bacterium]
MDRSMLFGLGFDCKDGQKRVTLGENFSIYGGSKKTHRTMQEKCVKFNEQLKKTGKSLDDIGNKEFCEIACKVGLEFPKRRF